MNLIRIGPILASILIMLGVGCASTAAVPVEPPTADGAGSAAVPTRPPTANGAGPPASGASVSVEPIPEKDEIPVGVSVGERPPHFAILLADGTTVTSEALALEGKSAFLMFFATW